MQKSYLFEISSIARQAGEIMKEAVPTQADISSKDGHANFVTRYDKLVQEYLLENLSALLPEAHFVGEEEGKETFFDSYKEGYTFVIDPIDGTTNFLKQYRPSVTSIGLLKDGKPFLGVIYCPYSKELFSAQKGYGSYRNEKPLSPSKASLENSLVLMGVAPYYDDSLRKAAFQLGHYYLQRCIDIRRSGSAAYDVCCVARGSAGLFYEPTLCLWDYAAGAVILEEAGGRITDMEGKPLTYTGSSSILAATQAVSKEDYLPPKTFLPWL